MICDRCRNVCEKCGQPINNWFPGIQQPWNPPYPVWNSGTSGTGNIPNNISSSNFMSDLINRGNEQKGL